MQILKYDKHKELIPFYVSRGLEFEADYDNTPVFSLIIKINGYLIGAATCSKTEQSYIIEAIAIDEKNERKGYGTILLNKVLEEIHNIGGRDIYLVTKNPTFFVKNNFLIINKEEAPKFSCCFACPEYQVKCFPKVMKYIGG